MSQLVPYLNFGLEDSQSTEGDYLYGYDRFENPKMFITLEGINSGVPTRTTPTLTPTTLRSIEQTFIELQSKPESHENEAGFVPPLVHSIGNNQYISASDADIYSSKSQTMWQNSLSQSSSDSNTRSTPPLTQKTSLINNTPNQTRRNMGGRKPTKDLNISPEEEERRRIRRERNKAAAARCRKRRVDHTNALILETEELEQKKQALQDDIQQLQALKDELDYILESHRSSLNCRLHSQSPPDIKPFPPYENRVNGDRVKAETLPTTVADDDTFSLPSPAKKVMLSSAVPISKPSRPNSLNVMSTAPIGKNNNVSDLTGIPITTPSTGMQFNFDSLMVGGTGLTPVSAPLVPSCSTQQRNIPANAADMTSPDACGPPKLVSL
ncbi:transcription factor kayak isoform X2 [Zophobas morio]|uniref:transcription factor kayak isoform X2 n=1 Tax=Zophobas morio TaxID=2755281 RepID=UPI00308347DE